MKKYLYLVLAISTLMYLRLGGGFFQQDEWFGFGWYVLHKDLSLLESVKFIFAPAVGHYTPLTILTIHSMYSLMGMNYSGFLALSLFLHGVVVVLVYMLSIELFKEKKGLAILSALVFATMAAPYQGTAWVVANIGTHGATIFGLISTIAFLRFVVGKDRRYFWISMIALFASLLFKEIAIGLFPLFLLLNYFVPSQTRRSKHIPLRIVVLGMIYVFVRFLMLFGPNEAGDQLVMESQGSLKLLYNFLTVPLKAVLQIVVPIDVLRGIADRIAILMPVKYSGLPGEPAFEVFAVKRVMETVNLLGAIFVLFGSLLVVLRKRSQDVNNLIVFGLGWVLVNSAVYSLAPSKSGVIFAVDSRNLYFLSVGTAIFLVALAESVWGKKTWRFGIFFGLVVGANLIILNQYLGDFAKVGSERRAMLEQIKFSLPDLPERAVIYTESDKSFYGLSEVERTLPFQSGFGQTLLVWYYPTEQFPKEFFKDRFLWEITAQGYRQVGDRGFGYFRDFGLLAEEVREQDMDLDSVFGFSYEHQNGIRNNSSEIKGRLEGYFEDKREVVGITLLSDNNPNDVRLMNDGDRKTAWDSGLTYNQNQEIRVDLGRKREVVQITIDSYTNRDQGAVGYRVLVSEDGLEWTQNYYSKRTPPNSDGLVKIYVRPDVARYLRVVQIGEHAFANWIIHEIVLYEKDS